MQAKEQILATAERLGITMGSKFVPWKQSRRANEKDPSLNWTVTLLKNGKAFITTDYSAGMGHCPSYRQLVRPTIEYMDVITRECQTGQHKLKRINPEFADVLSSLVSGSDALNHPTYESWASDLGYDTDSRKGEAIYRACLEIALKLRSAIGEDGLTKLREACQDY